MNDKLTKAYKEVLEIIKHLPEEEYNKIPKEKIDFYKENMDKDYEFTIDPSIDLSEQNISIEANDIIIELYQDYFATEDQKRIINEILNLGKLKAEQEEIEKYNKYNPDDLFNNKKVVVEPQKNDNQETALVEYKENFFTKFKNFILKLLHLKK